MINPTEAKLNMGEFAGKPRTLHFDFNTYAAFEEKTGKHFLEYISDLAAALAKAQRDEGSYVDVFRSVSISDMRALVWACMVEYDAQDNPTWPLSMATVGKHLTLPYMMSLLPRLMAAGSSSVPAPEEVRQAQGSEPTEDTDGENPTVPAPESSTPADGGKTSGALEEEVLDWINES